MDSLAKVKKRFKTKGRFGAGRFMIASVLRGLVP